MSLFNKIRIRIKRWVFFATNRLHILVQITRENTSIRITIPEMFKPVIKWIKWILSIVGLLTSLIVFSTIIAAFIVVLALWFLGLFLETFTFSYKILFVHPLPDFDIDGAKWLGMTFGGYRSHDGMEEIRAAGMLFSERSYAENVFAWLLRWNQGSRDDRRNNICCSIILKDEESYVFFAYPNPESTIAKRFFKQESEARLLQSSPDKQLPMFFQIVLGKQCKISPKSYIHNFIANYNKGEDFRLEIAYAEHENPVIVGVFRKDQIKIKRETELSKKDIEFSLVKLRE